MPINYIITCGTSQLDYEKLKFLKIFTGEDKYKKFNNWHVLGPEYAKGLDDDDVNNLIEGISTLLAESFYTTPDALGAELSTIKLRRPASDQRDTEYYRILSSDTKKGQLSAVILKKTLDKLGMQGDDIARITGLKDKPQNEGMAKTALNNLISGLFNALRTDAQNVFVISGGFKSVIPCITLFASLFGLEMVYLFEDSNLLQTFPATKYLHDPIKRQDWINYWDKTLYQNNLPRDSWLYSLFNTGKAVTQLYT